MDKGKEQGCCLWGFSNQGGRMTTKLLPFFSWIEELSVAWVTEYSGSLVWYGALGLFCSLPSFGVSAGQVSLCVYLRLGGGGSNFVSISLLFLGACLLGCACCPVDAPDLAFSSVTLRVFDKLSWTLCVVECQFVKYPKCGSCLASPGPGQSK